MSNYIEQSIKDMVERNPDLKNHFKLFDKKDEIKKTQTQVIQTVDFSVLSLLPQIAESLEQLKKENEELKQHFNPKYDLTKRAGVKAFLNISDGTLINMMKDGRFKQNIHYTKQINGNKVMITFVEDGFLAYKKGLE